MKNRLLQTIIVVVLLAGTIWVVWDHFLNHTPPVVVGRPAPDFELMLMDGGTITLKELRNRPVLINFWATYCPSCIDEMPAIESVYQAYRDQGFIVVGINTGESMAAIQGYVRRTGVTYPIALDPDAKAQKAYKVYDLPRSVFIDADGNVAVDHIGEMNAPMVENFLIQTIARRNAAKIE
ncbi:MAG: TlpA family protein disulfide reductase [Candidatus Carbobacillus altaicus]|nr:TlpA family protein disulfide reductase [Candidatus Carbobacillus altaicus]